MKATPATPAVMSTSEIARYARVTPATVSNWRTRSDGTGDKFPDPTETVGKRPLFRTTDVHDWLERRGRSNGLGDDSQREWLEIYSLVERSLTAAGEDAAATEVVDALCAQIATPAASSPSPTSSEAVERIRALSTDNRIDLFEWALKRRTYGPKRPSSLSTDELAQIVCALARVADDSSSASKGQQRLRVFDPAAGFGGFFIALFKQLKRKNESAEFVGQEIDPAIWRLANQRMLVHGVDADIRLGDTLGEDASRPEKFDLILCDPPWGVKLDPRPTNPPLWMKELGRASSDLAWLLICADHLEDGGHGFVVLPPGSLFREGREAKVRRRFLFEKRVEAVITLPEGLKSDTAIPPVIWVLRSQHSAARDSGGTTEKVLLIDGQGIADEPDGPGLSDALVQVLETWRTKGDLPEEDWSRRNCTAVPITDLVAGVDAPANLVPTAWITAEVTSANEDELRVSLAEVLVEVAEVRRQIAGSSAEPESISSKGSPPDWKKIRELDEDQKVTILRPLRQGPRFASAHRPAAKSSEERLNIWRASDFSGIKLSTCPAESIDGADKIEDRYLTVSGDVVICLASGRLHAVVDADGGNLFEWPVVALRVKPWLLPEVTRAAVEAPRNQVIASRRSKSPLVRLNELELPELAKERQREVAASLKQLYELESDARALFAATSKASESLVQLSGTEL